MMFKPLFVMAILVLPLGFQAESGFFFEKVDVNENKNYITSSFWVDTVAGQSAVSANFTVLKELNYRITVHIDSFIIPMPSPIRKAPKTNYCSLFGKNADILDYKLAFSELRKTNNHPLPCPIRPGAYQMKNFYMLTNSLPSFDILVRNNTRLATQVTLVDENGKRPVQVFSYKVFILYRK